MTAPLTERIAAALAEITRLQLALDEAQAQTEQLRDVMREFGGEGMTLWPRKFKGMIRPHMAESYESSRKIATRKTMFMVEYLRARRDPRRMYLSLSRRRHLESVRRLRGLYK